MWRDISNYFLPRRYPWLLTDKETRSASIRNTNLLDSTSITALRTLATGMMNGITSPTRPWFRLGVTGQAIMDDSEDLSYEEQLYLEDCVEVMLGVMAQSNFYQSLGILYLEWCGFGTASMGIYSDADTVIRCTNFPVGEFFLDTDYNGRVNRHARKFLRTVEQTVQEFGLENCSTAVQTDFAAKGRRLANPVIIYHLLEPNDPKDNLVRKDAPFREVYWEASRDQQKLLRAGPFDSWPTVSPRWETYGSDVYGSSPCMDALPDVLQLQQLAKRHGQGLDKMISPPMLVNMALANSPNSMMANGRTFVPGADLQNGARPVYQINVPFQELGNTINQTQARIQRVLFNDLFRMISDLPTVRSATEIDARREEKLILVGPVLDRFGTEGLDPTISRIFFLCQEAGLFREPPASLAEREIRIHYVGILSDAQRAVGTVPIERYLQLIGNMAAIFPEEVLDVPNPEEIIREYADAIGVKARLQRSRGDVAARREQNQQQKAMQGAAQTGASLIDGAKQLSETELGGGQNALAAILG
jgi:hypothetical protein